MSQQKHKLLEYLRQEILPSTHCPGCGCGQVLNAFVNAIHDLEIDPRTIISVTGIGCSSWIPSPYLKCDTLHTTHGRPVAFATGVKVIRPQSSVVVIAGDGDLAAIGGNHLIHAARRNVGLAVFLVNNYIYGMTGGQMAPTTLPGQVTTSSPTGRDIEIAGWPMRMAELIGILPGAVYVTRQAVLDVPGIRRTKKAIKLAFQAQLAGLGFSMVEVISTCNTNWHMGPVEALEWAKEHMVAYYPLGDTKVADGVQALKGGK